MQLEELFALALGINAPWQPWKVVGVALSNENKRLEIKIDFICKEAFSCPMCGDLVPALDIVEKTWRHMNFFQYEAYLTARVPRMVCSKDDVNLAAVPWARVGSSFTLLFEA